MNKQSSNDVGQKYDTNRRGNSYKINFDTYEIDELDLFPLFVHLVCTVKSKTIKKSQCIRTLPTCICKYNIQESL